MISTAPVISSTRLAAHPQRHQEAADLRRRRLARHQDVEGRARLLAGQRLAVGGLGDQWLEVGHSARPRQIEEVLQ